MPVESFKLYKEGSSGKITIHNAYTVERIVSRQQLIICFLDCFKVARSNISRSANEGKVLHVASIVYPSRDYNRAEDLSNFTSSKKHIYFFDNPLGSFAIPHAGNGSFF